MSDELGAVLEAPEEVVEQDIDVTPEGVAADVVDPLPEVKEETPGDWRKVPAELKDFFKTPAGKAAKDAWFERNAYKEKFPEGIKQVNELTSFLEEHGGREGIATALGELQSKAAEYDGIMENLEKGVLPELAPETISQIAPVLVDQWAKADREGWSAAMSGVFAATIHEAKIPAFLDKMELMLEFGKIEQAAKMVGDLKGWASGFAEKAAAPRTQPLAQPNKVDSREQALNQREEQMFTTDLKRDVDSFRSPLILKELDSFIKRRPNDSEAKELAIQTVRSQVIERMSNDAAFQKSLNALTQRKDREGAMRLIKSRETAAITEITPKVGRTIFGNPSATAPKPAPTAPKAEAGFALVDQAPKPELIDRFRTTDAMIMRGKFILKDGRKMELQG